MKKATMVLLYLLLSLIPGLAVADTAARPERDLYSPEFSQGTWGCGLNLTVEQTEKMRGLQEAFLQETKDLRGRLKDRQGATGALEQEKPGSGKKDHLPFS